MKKSFLFTIFINIFIGLVFGATIPGGWTTYDIKDEGVKNATTFAIDEYNKKSNSNSKFKLIEIIHAEGQIVAGINYRVEFVIGLTICKKEKVTNCCPFTRGKNKKSQLCKATIYSKPWENYMEVINLLCKQIK